MADLGALSPENADDADGVTAVQPASTECQHNPSTGSCQHQPWCRINNECNQHFNAPGVKVACEETLSPADADAKESP